MTNSQLNFIYLFIVLMTGFSFNVAAQSFWTVPYSSNVTQCPMTSNSHSLPDFSAENCQTLPLTSINPQQQAMWVEIEFDVPDSLNSIPPPLGLYFLGKASSRVWLNGVFLGQNGSPATDSTEQPGKMDYVYPIPTNLLQQQSNRLVIQLSAQHSIVELDHPLHLLGIGTYGETTQLVQVFLAPALILLGAFAIGVVYFLVLSVHRRHEQGTTRLHNPLFAAMCLLAMLQLGAELSRSLFNYSYPWQDIRLITITFLATLFGILLLVYNSIKVARQAAVHWIYAGSFLTLLVVIFVPGFDTKTTAGVFLPIVINLCQILWYVHKRKSTSLKAWFIGHLAIAVIIFISSSSFHEFLHFLLIGVVLLALFVQHAREYQRNYVDLLNERSHSARLAFRLAQQEQKQTPVRLEISSAGKTDFILSSDIVYGKAAGDYVELVMADGTEKLFTGTMKQLEGQLPDVFLRVHRSYLVNLDKVMTLKMDKNGERQGRLLILDTGHEVPVSRRLLPEVKQSIRANL